MMMKLLIAADMEGITGVAHWDHVSPGHADYGRFRRMMTGDVNAAIEGAAVAGVDDIVVADGHDGGYNILIEELDPRARLSSGNISPLAMVRGVDEEVEAAFFIGYHARMGTPSAILDHTWSSSRVANVWLNERLAGEIGMNAAVCGFYNVPVLMISGDMRACEEAEKWVEGIKTAQVKKASGRFSAECLPPEKSQALIRQTAEEAVLQFKEDPEAATRVSVDTPVRISIEFITSLMVDKASLLPGATRVGGRRIDLAVKDMPSAYMTMEAAIELG